MFPKNTQTFKPPWNIGSIWVKLKEQKGHSNSPYVLQIFCCFDKFLNVSKRISIGDKSNQASIF